MKKSVKIIAGFIPMIILCGIIFWFSEHNGQSSLSQSARVVEFIKYHFFPQLYSLSDPNDIAIVNDVMTTIVRKGAHFGAYTLLGLCSFSAFSMIPKKWIRYISSILFCLIFSISDEFHQTFVDGRTGKITDVFIDISGSVLGAFACLVIVFCIICHKKEIKAVSLKKESTQK